jgi:hypothetical protein
VDAQGQAHAEWVDQAKGVVRIPIEQAMADEVDTLKAQVPRACGEIPGTVPAPAPPIPGATNAAPVKPGVPAKPAAPGAKTGAGPAPATPKPNPANK